MPVDAAELDVIPLFESMNTEQRLALAGVCEELEVESGTVLVREGDFGHAVFRDPLGNRRRAAR